MKSSLGLLVLALGLLAGHALLLQQRRAVAEELREVLDSEATLSRDARAAAGAAESRRRIESVLGQLELESTSAEGIGALRERLIAAESGLRLDRMSLEFRPEERLETGLGGSRVQANLRGSYEALARYLARVEAMKLPLAAENLVFRGEDEDVSLTIRWTARWPLEVTSGAAPAVPSEVELDALDAWLSSEAAADPGRNPFGPAVTDEPAPALVEEAPPEPVQPAPDPDEPVAATPRLDAPQLAGFVLARPELERDVARRVLAALRFDGEVRLFQVGDAVGDYVVEAIEARESVTLARRGDGRKLRLVLQ